jgi:membrane protein implicated in regulation of membrane protease activity
MASVCRVLVGLVCSVLLGWMALAIYFDFSRLGPPRLRAVVGMLVPVAALAAVWLVHPRRWALAEILGAFVVVLAAWLAIPPSNERDWQPDVAALAFGEIRGDRVIVHNVRNAEYRTETDYTVRFEDREVDLSRLRSLDLFLIYWGSPLIAHTIMSWGFEGDQYLAISIETRKEKTKRTRPSGGSSASTSSSTWSRTSGTSCASRGEDVYVYRLDGSPAGAPTSTGPSPSSSCSRRAIPPREIPGPSKRCAASSDGMLACQARDRRSEEGGSSQTEIRLILNYAFPVL